MEDREFVLIQASHYRQACLVAEQLGVGRPNAPGSPVRFIDRPYQARGFDGSMCRIVFAYPRLEHTIIDRLWHDDCRVVLQMTATRAGAKIEAVTT